ncbi:iduronate 2-sulfatase [Trichogramma pretiosum]|uniref:iduronate 2-sulfatase n=1 Tax=Trichogramma pretiosum TaxID=7493 RepID=UPI0006C9909B|nr:iduronate 2-sulfatase [Trichogramma pretiosum]
MSMLWLTWLMLWTLHTSSCNSSSSSSSASNNKSADHAAHAHHVGDDGGGGGGGPSNDANDPNDASGATGSVYAKTEMHQQQQQQQKRKNFVFIIVDDLRPALGCYDDARAHTPNMDRLARRSVIFHRAYAQQSLCAPSRNSMLTSRRPDSLGLYDFNSYWRCVAGNFTTLPQHLKQQGYRTASLGKVFHPGASSNWNDDSPYSWTERPFHPVTDEYKDAPVCPDEQSSAGATTVLASNLLCPVRVSAMPNSTLPDLETLRASRRFLRSDHAQRPFFLAVGFQKPHIPLKYPKRYLKLHPLRKFALPDNYDWPANVSSVAYNPWTDLRRRSDVAKLNLKCPWQKIPKTFGSKIIQSYYAAVSYVDDLIGELLDEIDALSLTNDTVVVLTSDHGWSLGEHSLWAKYSNFEVALRVPLIMSIPDLTFRASINASSTWMDCQEAKSIESPVELLDVFPTLAEIAGAPVQKCPRRQQDVKLPDLCVEGSSLLKLVQDAFKNKTTVEWSKPAISQYPRPGLTPKCYPSSDEPKLRDIKIMGYSLRVERYRYTVWPSFSRAHKRPNWQEIHAEELYDHRQDQEENVNLAYSNSHNDLKTELKSILIDALR